ncbi:unnamed protein product [Chilo suppressalis]|uniref:Protein phosphatase 1 regulatory subunit 36 n=1 Tax=Chilo suppressalis TaxID=168631 RepID=A0ABN8APV0_CHISP|nr:unnamed protein product [Chilo suppressalis]
MFDAQDDDEDDFNTPYSDGHWEWSDKEKILIFLSNQTRTDEDFQSHTTAVYKNGPVEFSDDLDLLEQQRFRKRYQRKYEGEDDVIILQDIKDVVLFTAPTCILNNTIIKILHLQSCERFIRALILYCQYFLQVSDIMNNRLIEAESKVRTGVSLSVEISYRNNLEDLRLLVAKEYCNFILGAQDYKPFHHMGTDKKSKSLSNKEAFIFESLISIFVQIIWIALGRRAFNTIELEVHRIFKSQCFNLIEHRRKTKNLFKMLHQEKLILLGHCVQHKKKLLAQSPLLNEVGCHRPIDFRLLGLGYVKIDCLTSRQLYLERVLTTSETAFKDKGLTLGIIGLPRSRFDTMLMEVKGVVSTASSASRSSRSFSRTGSLRKSVVAASTASSFQKIFNDIVLPEKTIDKKWLPDSFPLESPSIKTCKQTQRDKWLARQSQLSKKYNFPTKKRQ